MRYNFKIKYLLFSYLLGICACNVRFKAGTYFLQNNEKGRGVNITTKFFFHVNGQYEIFIHRPRKLIDKLETGRWRRIKNRRIELISDSVFQGLSIDNVSKKTIYKQKISNPDILIAKIRIEGVKYRSTLIFLDSSLFKNYGK